MDTEKQKLNLLCDAAQLLLENGSETYRVEETAQRMAKGLSMSTSRRCRRRFFWKRTDAHACGASAGAERTASASPWSTRYPAGLSAAR